MTNNISPDDKNCCRRNKILESDQRKPFFVNLFKFCKIEDGVCKVDKKSLFEKCIEIFAGKLHMNFILDKSEIMSFFECEIMCLNAGILINLDTELILDSYKNILIKEIENDVKEGYSKMLKKKEEPFLCDFIKQHCTIHEFHKKILVWIGKTLYKFIKSEFDRYKELLNDNNLNLNYLIFMSTEFHNAGKISLDFKYYKLSSYLLNVSNIVTHKISMKLICIIEDELSKIYSDLWYDEGLNMISFEKLCSILTELKKILNHFVFYKICMNLFDHINQSYLTKANDKNVIIKSSLEIQLQIDIEKYYALFLPLLGAIDKKLVIILEIPKILFSRHSYQFTRSAAKIIPFLPTLQNKT